MMKDTGSTKAIDIQDITPDMVRSVYSGKYGKCFCGCSGTHYYNPKHKVEASQNRGYDVDDDEINIKIVIHVLRIIQSMPDLAKLEDGILSLDIGNKAYAAYLSDEAIENLTK